MAVTPKIRVKVLPQSKLRLKLKEQKLRLRAVPAIPGDAATVEVGTVTTLAAGSPATVANVGTPAAAVFDFGIPQGPSGSGTGDMLAAIYDPTNINASAFARANHTGTQLAATISDFSTAQASVLNTTAKGTPIDADRVYGGDSTSSFTPVYATWTQIKAFLKTYFDTLYQPLLATLTSWGAITRASGFDTFVATPSWTNFLALVTGEPTFYTSGGTDVSVADGGTGRSTSTTAYGLLAAGTTATGAHQTLAAGATTEILVGGGASALPAWTTATGTGAPVRAGSPALTGTPTAPTAAVDTNTTQLATTAMVLAQAAAATPLGNAATAVVGTATRFARADHVHPGREVLTAARTYYVRTDGSDSNNGLANTSGGAFLTVQKALDVAATIDFGGYTVTVQIADGTYTGAISAPVMTGQASAASLTIRGNNGTPANVILSTTSASTIAVPSGARAKVLDLEMRTTTSGFCFNVDGGTLEYGNVRFGACAQSHIRTTAGGSVTGTGNYTISGGAQAHVLANRSGVWWGTFLTVTLSGTPAFSVGFIDARETGSAAAVSMTFSGSATGPRYSITMNGVINTGGGGASYLPGNSAGSTATGGQYV